MTTGRDSARPLVVGANGLVGAALLTEYARAGQAPYGTTRRRGTVAGDILHLDLADDQMRLTLPAGVGVVFLAAAMADYTACEVDPLVYRVNVPNTVRLAGQVWEQGGRFIFISSNTVFGGDRPFCHEDDAISPSIAYSRHKAEAEERLKALARAMHAVERLTIVRLTKVLTTSVPPLPEWFARLEAGDRIRPFADLSFAPISLARTVGALRQIGDSALPGIFHLSGGNNVSYVEFARCLVATMGLAEHLVVPTTAQAAGVKLGWSPRYSGIGMARTTRLLGIEPEPLETVVAQLVAERRDNSRTLRRGP
jgi:dTDP-4-dehydrorhamnose reductase